MVTGVGGPAGRSAASYFHVRGFPVAGTDIRIVDAGVDPFHLVPAAVDPLFPARLMEIIKQERPSMLVPTVTEELPVIARLRKSIEDYGCRVFISPPSSIDIANDKFKTSMVMAGNGIHVPVSFDDATPREFIIEYLGFPLLSKPRHGRGGRGVKVYENPEELFQEARTGLVYQEFIPGDEFDVNLFLDRKGDAPVAVVLKKTQLKGGIVGNALTVERVERPDVVIPAVKAAQILHLEGPVDMDVRLRRDGTPVLLEINARIGGNVLSAPEILDYLLDSCFAGLRGSVL